MFFACRSHHPTQYGVDLQAARIELDGLVAPMQRLRHADNYAAADLLRRAFWQAVR